MDCSEDLPPNDENIINKNFENDEIGESSCSKNAINDSLLAKDDLPEFSDSRIRLNKIIGFAKLNKSDASIPHTELTTHIFDEMIRQKNGPVIYKDMVKRMDDIDVNYKKNVIDGIKRASCMEPIQPPPLPPSDLMDLGASRINLSTTKPNSSEVTRGNVILSKSWTNIHAQLNTGINKLHKTGLSNETKPKFISALKPSTLIDLENSKVVCDSLTIESLRPVIESNEKSTEVKTSLADINVPCCPIIRDKTLLTSGKNINPFNTPALLISNAQYTFSTNTQTPFALNRDNSNAKLFDTRGQELYNGQSSSSHTYIQLKNKSLSLNQNKHNHSDHKKNGYSQFSNSTQMHVNPSHIERLTNAVPYKSHNNDASKKDLRTLKSVKTTAYPKYKEYREAKSKFREKIKGYVKNKNKINQDHDKYRSLVNKKMEKSNIIDSSYNTFGPLNDTANIKKFKIPKIKHNKELNDNSIERNSKLKTLGDNKNDTDVLTTEKKSKINLKADTIRDQYLVNGQKSETNKSKNLKKDHKITDKITDIHMDKPSEIEITKNSSTDKDLSIKTLMMNNESEKDSCPEINLEEITVDIPSKDNKEEVDSTSNSILINSTDQSKPKKHKKYSKEKEFKKIIKDTAERLNDDVLCPSTRTRSSVVKKEGIIQTIKVNNSKPKFEKDNTTKNYKKLESGDCSKNLDNGSIPNLGDVSGRTEIGHNIISSTLKVRSGVVNSSTTEVVCKSQEENIVSSNEINSTADNSPKIDNNALIDILKIPNFMTVISIFQDEDKMKKLNKLLESSDVITSDDELKKKGILNKEQIEIDKKIMIKKKMKKEKRKRKIMNKSVSEESSIEQSKNEYLNDLSDNNCNQALNKKGKLNSETLNSLMTEQPIVLIRPHQNLKPFDDETNSNKSVEQNSNTSTFTVNKPGIKKARISELDKLHAGINEMFKGKVLLNASNIRQCRINKQIDYEDTNVVMSKKNKTSKIEPLDLNDDQNKYDHSVRKINNTKNKVKKSTIKLNTKKKFVKKSMANKTLPPVVVKTALLNKISNKQQEKFKKTIKKNKKCMKSNRKQLKVVSSDDLELKNVLKNNISTEITSKTFTENKFKDKFYFQTADNSLECKFCNYKDKGLNIVRHYKEQHCKEEVLPSRLPKNCTESLIHQSLRENFGYSNSQDSKLICHRPVNVSYTCVFCQVISHDYFKFYDHITGHTGEYRYKCKMCEQIYLNEDDLDKHILEHTGYDKTCGISHLIFPNPICSKYIFGYLCSFCYYIQLDYDNIVKHMVSQHFDEDKKLNGHWTVLRISMSMADNINTDSSIDFDNLVGCLPPIQPERVISKSKDNEDQNQQLTVMGLNVLSNEQKQPNFILSIKKQFNKQNIDEIPQESNIDEYSPKSNIVENLAKSVTHANPPVTVYDKVLESTKLKFLPEQANQSSKEGTRITTEPLAIEYSEYTLKEKSKKCVIAGLSCELINSMLLFKCSVSNCREDQFSTVFLIDFSNHINKNHKFVVWDRHCEACHHKLPIVSDQNYVRNALEHLVSHHLVLKNNEQHPNTAANLGGSNIECLSSCQDTVQNTPFVKNFLKIRCLPGDNLSTQNNMFGNPDQSSHNVLLGTQCQTSVSLKVNHGSNDKRFPSQITDVKSLKKAKVNTSKIHSSASDNSGLNTWMKVKTNCEVIHEPLCLERSTVSDNCESKNIRNLKILKLTNVIDNGMVEMVNLPAEAISVPEVLPQRSKKRSIECPDVLSSAMKSARIYEGSQASDTIVITVPNGAQMAESSTTMSLAIDNEFIMTDDVNQNQSEFNNKEKEPTVSANDDFIVFEDKTIEQKKQKMNTLFTCKKCSFKGNTLKIIISHVKTVHNAEQNVDCEDSLYKITPEITSDTNNSVNFLMPQHNEQQNASLKRKSSTNFGNQKGSPKAKPIVKNQSKTMFFSPDTIDSIPKCHIFSDLINCLLCTYSTRVRSNLVIHLNRHTKGQDNTTKEIVNPVPSIGKCELMFDKMINFSANAFDAMNTENIKRDELDQKIVEVAPDDTLNTEIFPKFIPKKMLYKCSIIHCTYTGKTKDMLKKHTSILHPTHECYICPHCLPLCNISKLVDQNQIEFHLMHHGANLYRCQYCEYIHFNRVEMRTHMRNTHLSDITSSIQSNIIVIRQTMLEDDSIDRGRSIATFNVPQWVCNICSNGLRYSENEITSHILMAHKISNMFKCPMCQFEHENDNANIFKEHYKSEHPSVAVKCFRVFEKISDKEELHKQSEHLGSTENMLRQQALESIEPTLVPLTVRGIPIEFTPLKTTSVESSKAIIVDSKRTSYSTTKEKNIKREKKAFISHPIHEPVSNDDIISLVDDSDDE